MKLKDDAFESYMRYDKATRELAETWAGCMEMSIKGGMTPLKAIISANSLISFGTKETIDALTLLAQCWEHGAIIMEWYCNMDLLINI